MRIPVFIVAVLSAGVALAGGYSAGGAVYDDTSLKGATNVLNSRAEDLKAATNRIDTSLYGSAPPAFQAYNSANFGFSNNTTRTITWNTEVYDYGGNWDGTTFTASQKGLYRFQLHALALPTAPADTIGYVNFSITKNGVAYANRRASVNKYGSGSDYTCMLSATMSLTSGAYVAFIVSGTAATTGYVYGSASYTICEGMLVRELP